jgi:hypothetical protein
LRINPLKYVIIAESLDTFSASAERKKGRMKRMREMGIRGGEIRTEIIKGQIHNIVMEIHEVLMEITLIEIIPGNTIVFAIGHLKIDRERLIIEEMIRMGEIRRI